MERTKQGLEEAPASAAKASLSVLVMPLMTAIAVMPLRTLGAAIFCASAALTAEKVTARQGGHMKPMFRARRKPPTTLALW